MKLANINEIREMAAQAERRRAEKVAQFLEMLLDPDLANVVALLRGNHHASEEPLSKQLAFLPPKGFKNGNGIREAIRALRLPQEFSADDVLAHLESDNFHFSSPERKAAVVRDALRALVKKREMRIKKHGTGGKTNIYERI